MNKTVTIENKWGLHAKASFILAKKAGTFEASITLDKDGAKADAKRMDDILTLMAGHGDIVTIMANGPDEKQAIDSLTRLFESKFDEDK